VWVKGELFDDFESARAAALTSLDRENQPGLFDRMTWFESLWQYCPPGGAPLIARARAENCDAWLFLARTGAQTAVSLSNWYTLSFRPVFSGNPSEETQKNQLIALARRLGLGLSTIKLTPVPENDGTTDLIVESFQKAGWIVNKSPRFGNWTTKIDTAVDTSIDSVNFPQFWADRPGEVRSTYSRKLKKFGVTTDVYTEFNETAWEEYERIYASSWKGNEGSPEFLTAMAKREGEAGTLRLGIARLDGEAIAAQLWTIENGHAIIHKLAYREDLSEMSAGTILSHDMFERAIDTDKVTLIDYGTGDDRYKQSWMQDRQQLFTITMFNSKRFAGLIGAAKYRIKALLGKNAAA
jgi:Acetyltransferase (GNAT) domain